VNKDLEKMRQAMYEVVAHAAALQYGERADAEKLSAAVKKFDDAYNRVIKKKAPTVRRAWRQGAWSPFRFDEM